MVFFSSHTVTSYRLLFKSYYQRNSMPPISQILSEEHEALLHNKDIPQTLQKGCVIIDWAAVFLQTTQILTIDLLVTRTHEHLRPIHRIPISNTSTNTAKKKSGGQGNNHYNSSVFHGSLYPPTLRDTYHCSFLAPICVNVISAFARMRFCRHRSAPRKIVMLHKARTRNPNTVVSLNDHRRSEIC